MYVGIWQSYDAMSKQDKVRKVMRTLAAESMFQVKKFGIREN